MKKLLLSMLLCGILSATSVLADAFTGPRIGVGISDTSMTYEGDDYELWRYDYGRGFKLEYGYDFNQMIGIGISYETNDDTIEGGELQGQATKLSFDLGAAFPIRNAFPIHYTFLKPYAKLGLMYYSEESSRWGEFDDDNIFVGFGGRFQSNHFYADLSLDYYLFDDEFAYLDIGLTQTALTVGYKF